jgi:hypothetical protein
VVEMNMLIKAPIAEDGPRKNGFNVDVIQHDRFCLL